MKTTRVLTGTGAGRGIRAVRPLSARARAGVASRGSGHAGRAVARAASSKEDQGEDRMTYAGAGVNIDAGNELVRRIQAMDPSGGIGGFGGLFPLPALDGAAKERPDAQQQYLVAGTDGVGTKLKLAFDMDSHGTIGVDLWR